MSASPGNSRGGSRPGREDHPEQQQGCLRDRRQRFGRWKRELQVLAAAVVEGTFTVPPVRRVAEAGPDLLGDSSQARRSRPRRGPGPGSPGPVGCTSSRPGGDPCVNGGGSALAPRGWGRPVALFSSGHARVSGRRDRRQEGTAGPGLQHPGAACSTWSRNCRSGKPQRRPVRHQPPWPPGGRGRFASPSKIGRHPTGRRRSSIHPGQPGPPVGPLKPAPMTGNTAQGRRDPASAIPRRSRLGFSGRAAPASRIASSTEQQRNSSPGDDGPKGTVRDARDGQQVDRGQFPFCRAWRRLPSAAWASPRPHQTSAGGPRPRRVPWTASRASPRFAARTSRHLQEQLGGQEL
jgi:hypothetical protein